MTQISILGCGWLGLPLAKALLKKGFAVKGSTTTFDKLETLKKEGIDPHQIALGDSLLADAMQHFLEGSEVLIINIPPSIITAGSDNYPAKMQQLIPHIEKAGIQKVLFVSATSVYADEDKEVPETTPANPDTESGRQILDAEKVLQTNPNFKTTVLRLGGLFGEERHPIKYLAGRENIANPNAPINLIHLDDCIGISLAIIDKEVWGEVFNGVMPNHPTREEYYCSQAKAMGLPLPKFNHSVPSVGKTIVTDKVVNVLGYTFSRV
ncbi:SDR family oxidoreductase [Flavobacterium subsaxonicum]|uniref:Epimerase n=1 Tax=Flavobacterium subsaxonicum WB 4.1-42 = DSM 21790 TaxID=1121898 RepID=A0A0A2MT36_9FLAO|nr:SDR family oxidoreductase [Flavobacterium subsaxonicum]KGO91400.1 epimerase [Flavobacterium subsaxonicum WB 4.1-42 = DSM 21790]